MPLASWAHAIGASSVTRSVLGSELQGACLSLRQPAYVIHACFVCTPLAKLVF